MQGLRILLFILVYAGSVYSQSYDFKNIGKEKKLPAKYIYDITQGQNQKLYLGTEEGLFSYDGLDFDHLVKSKENIINVISVDRHLIYLGYFDGGIGIYNVKNQSQSTIKSPFDSKIINIEILHKRIIVLIEGEGLFELLEDQFKPINVYNLDSYSITNIESVQDNLLLTTSSDLMSLENAGGKWLIKQSIKQYVDKFPIKIEISDTGLCAILCNDLSVDIFGISNGVYKIQNVIHIRDLNTRPTDLHFGVNNQLWISTINEGIIKVSSPDDTFLSYNFNFFNSSNGLLGDEVKSIFIDNQGVLWIGHYGQGITRLGSEQVVLYENFKGVKLNNVNCIDQHESKGIIYLGHDYGVWMIEFGSSYAIDSLPIPAKDIRALRFDHKNTLWIGSAEDGLFLYNIETGELKTSLELFGEDVLYINRITLNHNNGNIYISTDLGLYYYEDLSGSLTKLTTNDGLAHNVINDVLYLKSGEIWFASNGSPMFSLKNKILSVHKDLEGLTSYSTYCIKESSDNRILVGTESDGLVVIKDEKVISRIDESVGLLDNTVFDIIELENGEIWTFHKTAISILDQNLKVIRSFSSEEDMFGADLTRNGVHSSNSNYIWAACNRGLLRVLRTQNIISIPPSIEINNFYVNDKEYRALPDYFKYGSYSFKMDFLAVDLSNPLTIQYEYYLEGLETNWNVYNSNHNFASYPKLTEGDYIFKLRAKNIYGQYSSEIQVPFKIEIPYWKSLWFLILVPAFILLMIFLFFHIRLIRVRKQKFRLEVLVRDRTYELRLEKDNLSQAKLHIEHKNKEITDSINYAERIQKAILPDISDRNILKEEDFFLFYRPCDIVSGDFYWINYVDGKQIIVVADCTGHGVPGAFMSLISSTLIDKIVFDFGITDPEGMVRLLDSNIDNVLKTKESGAKDGIDIGILTIDRINNEVEYCGASRPLYVVREDELEVYKGGMLAIGDSYENIEKKYITHKFGIEKGITLYISSDGFPDQFGGENDRKYMVGKFKKFLFSIRKHDTKTQESLVEDEFVNWKKDTAQTDDVLVVGIKL